MLRFEWTAYVTPAVVSRVAAEMGVTEALATEATPLLASILSCVGGLPFVAAEPTPDERTTQGLMLLAEAAAHTLAECGALQNVFGYVTSEGVEPFYGRRVVAQARVNVNSANRDEIATLPGLTRALVDEILVERHKLGRFTNLDDFERRVKGVGAIKAKALAQAITFDGPHDSRRMMLGERGDLGANLRALIALQPDADRTASFRRTLEMILTSCSTNPHPATRESVIRDVPRPDVSAERTAEWIGELWSDDYWKDLPALIGSALQTIEVCMFHMAAPNPAHPTFALMDALRTAHQRGVAVRVLLDRDGKKDPYLSTIINSEAKRFFMQAGIACRSDSSARLLHSKYLILDKKLAVIGSHNWSAGSYFGFDDLTLAISSVELASDLGARFEAQWSTGS